MNFLLIFFFNSIFNLIIMYFNFNAKMLQSGCKFLIKLKQYNFIFKKTDEFSLRIFIFMNSIFI